MASGDNILLIKMFTGEFGRNVNDEGEKNIPHELVSLYLDDNDRLWFYKPDDGTISEANSMFREAVILFVFNMGKEKGLRIIAQAKIKRYEPKTFAELKEADGSNAISYGSVSITDIFSSGQRKGKDKDTEVLVTGQLDPKSVRIPKIPLLIRDTDCKNLISHAAENGSTEQLVVKNAILHKDGRNKDLIRRSLYNYIDMESEQYRSIKEIMAFDDDDPNCSWIRPDQAKDVLLFSSLKDMGLRSKPRYETIWELLRRDNDEASFSNVLRFLIQESATFAHLLINQVLEVKSYQKRDRLDCRCEVTLGTFIPDHKDKLARMDLVIETAHDILIIENKINAPLGRSASTSISEHASGVRDDASQLDTYYKAIGHNAKRGEVSKAVSYFLVCPSHNFIEDPSGRFATISYGTLEDKFKNPDVVVEIEKELFSSNPHNDRRYIFYEFLNAIGKHGEQWGEMLQNEMIGRFLRAIRKERAQG